MRLIDAEVCIEKILGQSVTGDLFGMGISQGLKNAENIINEAPTIDPVKHGKWLETSIGTGDSFNPLNECIIDALQCSVCSGIFDFSEARNYCPNCGAKMDEEEPR